MTPEEVRADLQKRLRRVVLDGTWDYVVKKFYVAEVMDEDDPYTIEHLAEEVLAIWAAAPADRGVGERASRTSEDSRASSVLEAAVRSEAVLDKRAKVLSKLLAAEASRDAEVLTYRDDHLGGQTIFVKNISRWLDSQWQIEMASKDAGFDPRTEMIRLAYIGEWQPWDPSATDELDPDRDPEPDPGWYAVPIGGPLEQLVLLSERLSDAYGWQEAEATTFVLTGQTPNYFPVAVRRFRKVENPSVASRITVDLDLMLTPQQLARMWIYLRKAWIGRPRSLSVKHMELAEFVAQSGGTWERRWTDWNNKYPEQEYRLQSNFVRDAKAAKKRLLSVPFREADS
jgi:hypothetical protein